MGFGILFIGYFVAAIIFIGYMSIVRVLGCAVMLISTLKLRKYNRTFDMLLIVLGVCILFYGFDAVVDILGITLAGTTATLVLLADTLINFALNSSLLLSIRAIAKETETDKLYFAATRNLVFFGILLVLQLIAKLPFKVTQNLNIIAIILLLVLSVLNLVLIFRCYAQICDSGDVEMERKPSRFAFVNKYRDEMDKRRAEADAERERIKRERDIKGEQKRRNKKNKK
ncbi:MAG: hypothetical protein E7653_00535 [Ruminococcaceae bacterium]|nr:hypothetical protein [Oscillospiraceae bacterium]